MTSTTPARGSHAVLVLPGEVLAGKYKIERVLGCGGEGVVVAARHLQLGERVAIKLLACDDTAEARDRMLRGAKAAARIRGDHVVVIHDVVCMESEPPCIVMEYLEGEDLRQLLSKSGAAPAALAVHWVLQACEALAEAHRQGIVHRDLKPANLFLERRSRGSVRIKVLDFGIAKLPDGGTLTQAGQFMGSPPYMAPEQLTDARDVDARTDIWSLGVVLYELLTAQSPFAASSRLEVMEKVRDKPHASVASIQSDVPVALSQVVDRCLVKSREGRWQEIVTLAQALAPFAPSDAQGLIRSIERISGSLEGQLTLRAEGESAGASGNGIMSTSDAVPASLAATVSGKREVSSRLLRGAVLAGVSALLAAGVYKWRPTSSEASPVSKGPGSAPPSVVNPANALVEQRSVPPDPLHLPIEGSIEEPRVQGSARVSPGIETRQPDNVAGNSSSSVSNITTRPHPNTGPRADQSESRRTPRIKLDPDRL